MGKHGGFFGSHRPCSASVIIPGVSVTTDLALLCDGDRFEITSVEDVKGRRNVSGGHGKGGEARWLR